MTSVLSDPHEVGTGLKLSRRLVDLLQARLHVGRDIRKTRGNTCNIESGPEHAAETFWFVVTYVLHGAHDSPYWGNKGKASARSANQAGPWAAHAEGRDRVELRALIARVLIAKDNVTFSRAPCNPGRSNLMVGMDTGPETAFWKVDPGLSPSVY